MPEPGIGHNSRGAEDDVEVGGIAADRLRSFIDRIERLMEEKQGLADDIKEVFAEAKGTGFDTKVIRKLIAIRKRERADVIEEQALLELYAQALGMLDLV
jgi:uncharacterized protein (UPF0335 family)